MKKRVLILSCGSLAATDMNISLRDNEEFEIFGSSVYKNHGVYVYKNYISDIPQIKDENFIKILNEKIAEYNIKFLVCTHEDICLYLQANNKKINAIIVHSNYDTALLCRYKSKTYEKMKKYDFVPKTFQKEEVKEFPVFIKKDTDQGARNAYKVQNQEQLEFYTSKPEMVICEYLPGEEVTVDCFTNKDHKLLFCNPRASDRMLAGIDVHARRIELSEEIKYIAESLNKEIEFRGFWFFQIKKDINGKFKLLEISTRMPGAFSLSRCLDVNLLEMALKDFDGQDVDLTFNDINIEADKQFFGKYALSIEYDEIYIDFKTCFESLNNINPLVMLYLYQCSNKNIKINLLTENTNNTLKYLEENKIAKSLFKEIIEISRNETKDVLKEKSILLSNDDNLKNEIRKKNKNYCCFSNNIIEALIDWRS